ncbi:energy transducer TonB [Aquaspirillum sp. LM1]|uniref:energy transducer TonB n=1 Tax=Aquaspirillum sp. LM1 TaxID=1938604 RepID=UPI0012371990|nr:energy transducer TonB [Aquaspirillum sp. LM1]
MALASASPSATAWPMRLHLPAGSSWRYRQHWLPVSAATVLHAALVFGVFWQAQQSPPPLAAPSMQASILPPSPLPMAAPEPAKPTPPKPQARAQPVKPTPRPPVLVSQQVQPTSAPVSVAPAPPTPPAPSAPAQEAVPARSDKASPSGAPASAPRFDAAYLNNPAPAYPAVSRRLGEEGRVLLAVQVDADGAPRQVRIARSSGYPRLDAAAQAAVEKWRFVPARQGEHSVAASVNVPIHFRLDDAA